MFKKIFDLNNAIIGLTVRDVFRLLFLDHEFTDLIIRLNTEGEQTSQLIYGVDSKGEQLGEYSPYTMFIKEEKGQISDHVTLKDTGGFYRSFRTIWKGGQEGAIIITADPIKYDAVTGRVTDLLVQWGRDILGMHEQNLEILRDYARKKTLEIVKREIKKAA